MVNKSEKTIVILTPFLGGFFLGQINAFLRYSAKKMGFKTIFIRTNSFESYNLEFAINQADAVVIVLNAVSREYVKKLVEHDIPVVTFAADHYHGLAVDQVFSNNMQGTELVVNHLIALGHKNLAIVVDLSIPDIKVRLEAFKQTLLAHDLQYNPDWVFSVCDASLEGGREAAESFLPYKDEITAVVCTADLIALGFIQAVKFHGIACPENVIVTGYEATSLAMNHIPTITSVDQQLYLCSEIIFNVVTQRLAGGSYQDSVHYVEQALFLGNSSDKTVNPLHEKSVFFKRNARIVKEFYMPKLAQHTNESMLSFARAGFDSLLSVSYLFGPFFHSGYKAVFNQSDENAVVYIVNEFLSTGQKVLSVKHEIKCSDFPIYTTTQTQVENENNVADLNSTQAINSVTLIPILTTNNQSEVVVLFDVGEIDFIKLTEFQNYLDMIYSSLERDSYALLAQQNLIELKNTQDQLVESAKMSALGRMVAGVAHEVNTPLGVCMTAISHLKSEVSEMLKRYQAGKLTRNDFEYLFEESDTSLKLALSNISRASDIIKSFKEVSADQSSEQARDFLLNEVLANTVDSFKYKLKKISHRIEMDFLEDVDMYSYPGAISQILLNLIMNSFTHGFKNMSDGLIEIQMSKCSDTEVLIIYRDTGEGINDSDLVNIFDPFFTTNRTEGNTGLGMHISYNLVTQKLNGQILANSFKHHGCEFYIRLPLDVKGE